jgi:hypothetical protein
MRTKPGCRSAAVLLAAASLVSGCHLPAPRQTQPGPHVVEPAPGLAAYCIDAGESDLRILVYRAGTMAKLGHDHVIENHALNGWVALAPGAAGTSFDLQIPAAAFVIDDEAARAAAGPDFAEDVGDDAKQGTRRNMLGPALLDAEHHASIEVRSVAFRGVEPGLDATVAIEVAGREATVTVPVSVVRGERRLTVSAAFALRQTDLGLTPFSVMLGALRVADEIKLRLRLVAVSPCSR